MASKIESCPATSFCLMAKDA